jgi:hypothetical protein
MKTLSLCLSTFVLAAATFGQVRPTQPPTAKNDQLFFQQDPLKMEAVGLTLLIPEGAEVDSSSMGSVNDATLQDKQGRYVIKIQTPRTAKKDLTLSKLVNDALTQLLDSNRLIEVRSGDVNAKATAARLISREPDPEATPPQTLSLRNGGSTPMTIERFYVELPPITGSDPLVRGFTAAKISSDQFITFELFTNQSNFEAARQTYELCVGSAVFENTTKAQAERAATITAGVRLMGSVKREDIEAVIAAQPERWERLYRASQTGKKEDDTEVGYRRIRLSTGREAGASREGYIVRIDARFLDGTRTVDSQSFFHMTYDRKEENWTVRMAIKDDPKNKSATPTTAAETGARFQDQLTVHVEATGQSPKSIKPTISGEGYISRVESFLLPQLLVRKQMPAIYGFYTYQTQSERITLRRDELKQPENDNQAWMLTTRLMESQPELLAMYNTDGTLLTSDMGNKIIAEPSTVQELNSLWKSKGLPMN